MEDNFKQKKARLADLVREGRVRCEKHETLIGLKVFYGRRCYISKGGDVCPYLNVRDCT